MNPFRTLAISIWIASMVAAQRPEAHAPSGWTARESAEMYASQIVRGRVTMPDAKDLDRSVERGGGYIEFDVHIAEVLKGPSTRFVRVTFYAAPVGHPHGFAPTADDLRSSIDSERIVFLQRIGSRLFLADRFHQTSLLVPTQEELQRTRAMIARHAQFAQTEPGPDVPFATEVGRILDDIRADPENERLGFIRLQTLGSRAIPAIVRHLGDSRAISNDEILLLRSAPDVDVPYRALRPALVGDALFGVLCESSGETCGVDPERVDPNQRTLGIERWRIFAQYVLTDLAVESQTTSAMSRR